jgi:WXG100 family type VII secretion target
MASFQTGSAEMLAAVKSMEEVNQSLQQSLKNLESEVEAVAGAWQGNAATAFNNLMMKFNEDATNLNKDLSQIAEAVTGNNSNYQAQEESAQSSMTSILGGL